MTSVAEEKKIKPNNYEKKLASIFVKNINNNFGGKYDEKIIYIFCFNSK